MTRSSTPRDATIDCLRGAAISVVLLLHFALAFGLADSPLGDLLGKPLLRAIVLNGNYGVTVFFVVSGYLITHGLLARHGELSQVQLAPFYVARSGRILPPLLLALCIIVPLGWAGVPFFDNSDGQVIRPASFWWPAVGSVLTFWHNQLMQTAGYFNYCLNVYWSLSVEEVFYLTLPCLCLLLRREAWIAVALCAIVLLGPAYRARHPDNEIAYLYAYPACFDAIALGCLCALASRRWPAPRGVARVLAPVAAVSMVATYLVGFADHPVFGFSAMAGETALLIWSSRAWASPPLAWDPPRGWARAAGWATRPWRWLGRHSYEIYLFHIIVLAGLRQVFDRATLDRDARLPLLVGFVLVSVAVAAVVSRLVSEPMNRWWRQRWSVSAVPVSAPG